MATRNSKDSKLIVLPEKLVARLKDLTTRKGISLTGYATEALEQAIIMDQMGAKIDEAVDVYKVYSMTRAAGIMNIPRVNFNNMIQDLYKIKKESLWDLWNDAGKWNGEYLRARVGKDALMYLRNILLFTWNLEEVNITKDGIAVSIRYVSFFMSLELTKLLNSYIKGVMNSLGYEVQEVDYIKGLASLKFREVEHLDL